MTRPIPGGELITPLPLLGAGLMVLNDVVLRHTGPEWLSGKLSDVGAMMFVPFVLTASYSWLLTLLGLVTPLRDRGLTITRLVVAAGASGALLAGINLSAPVNSAFLELLIWLDVLGLHLVYRSTMDPSDVLALGALPLTIWWGLRYIGRQDKEVPR